MNLYSHDTMQPKRSDLSSFLISVFLLLGCLFTGTIARAQSLEGCVTLNESTPAAYATIYLPALGLGTITDQDGRYLIDELPLGTHTVEYSFLGYRTAKRNLIIDKAGRMAHDERLEEQPITLSDVYITPNGEDPAIYILKKVAEQAAINRKRLASYEASVTHTFHAQDIDFLPVVLPKAYNWAIKTLIKAFHMGAIYDVCTQNEKVDAKVSVQHHYAKGKTKYDKERVISSTPVLPDKAKQQLFKLTHDDIFDQLYGDDLPWGSKAIKKGYCNFKLKGTIEENGQVIDVLVSSRAHDKYYYKQVLYVIEDNWCILRMENDSSDEYERTECRNIGDGIYLPVSKIDDPKMVDLNLTKMIDEYKEDMAKSGKKPDKTESKIIERLEQFIANRQNLRPCMTSGYNIKYDKVVIQ